ncbi:MAG: sulfite oxidase heme-binding subunit YedZ [Terriglobales bacterium]
MKPITWLKIAVFLACLAPVAQMLWMYRENTLGPNPIEYITHLTGKAALVFILITLAITPLRRLTGQAWLISFRRMLGLFAFFYGCLHLTIFVWLDKYFDWQDMIDDVTKRPFITFGFAALMLMLPLALTSTNGWVSRLGGKRWQALHRLIYASAILACVHFWWKVKADHTEPGIYAGILTVLLGYRVVHWAWPLLKSKQRVSVGSSS